MQKLVSLIVNGYEMEKINKGNPCDSSFVFQIMMFTEGLYCVGTFLMPNKHSI